MESSIIVFFGLGLALGYLFSGSKGSLIQISFYINFYFSDNFSSNGSNNANNSGNDNLSNNTAYTDNLMHKDRFFDAENGNDIN